MVKIEIEKKFLVEKRNLDGLDIAKYPQKRFVQGYISTNPTIRLRDENGEYVLCVKADTAGLGREELEITISEEQFDALWKKVETNAVVKTRYFIPLENGLTAELDVYLEELHGLVTVEVEFETEEDANTFVPPKWFGRDVTFDRRYKNTSLSICGKPE